MALIGALCAALPGEVKRIDAYRANVQPCTGCRHCRTQVGCAIDDGMQEIYRDIAVADCIVLASPVYFSCLTGPLMSLLSRLQVFYTAQRFHGVRMGGQAEGRSNPALRRWKREPGACRGNRMRTAAVHERLARGHG